MAGLGRKDFQAGAVLSAADVDGYLMDQSVMKFANTAAAGSAYGTAIAEGMTFYLSDTDEQVFHDGTRFVKQNGQENLLTNGDFRLWSRGTSFTGASPYYTADRWQGYRASAVTGGTFSRQSASLDGFEYCLRLQRNSGNTGTEYLRAGFAFETAQVKTFQGKSLTLSFYARAGSNLSATSNQVVTQIVGGTGTDSSLGNGFTSPSILATATQTITTSWVRYTLTLSSLTNTYSQLGVVIQFTPTGTAGANDYIDITGVQLEVGTAPTPFERVGGTSYLDTAASGAAGFDGVLVSTGVNATGSGSGTPAWAGFDVAGKNKVINGGFDFWQRGTSFATSGSIYAGYGADRWRWQRGQQSAGLTVSRQAAGLTGFQYAIRVQRDSGNATTFGHYIAQSLETVASIPLAGQTLTLSFYARAGANYSGASNALNVQLGTGTGTDENLLNGYTGLSNIVNTTVTLTTSWQRFTVSGITATNVTELGMTLFHNPVGTAGAADYFEVTGVQLEAGSVATPFSRAGGTLQGELAACQRYMPKWGGTTVYSPVAYGAAYSTTVATIVVPLGTAARTSPTIVEYSGLALYDGVAAPIAVTSLVVNTQQTDPNSVTLLATVASGLTQYRPYYLLSNNSTASYMRLPVEL